MDRDERSSLAERVGPYRLVHRIGAGGMGTVHLGLDPDGRTVAVKVLHPAVAADRESRARLAREVETMRRAASPYVAEVLDADLQGERPYLVTRYVQGRPLEEVVKSDGPLTGSQLTRLARGLAEGIAVIHATGVVHRDIKPSNVMLVDGEPVIIDFGVAHTADATKLTQTGTFMGTPAYLAPEMLEGATAGTGADIHAWGAVVAFAATGRSPFGSGSVESVFANIAQGRADLNGIPEPLTSMVRSALARDPAGRPPATWLRERANRLDQSGLAAPVPPPRGEPGGSRPPGEPPSFLGATTLGSRECAETGRGESEAPRTRAYTSPGQFAYSSAGSTPPAALGAPAGSRHSGHPAGTHASTAAAGAPEAPAARLDPGPQPSFAGPWRRRGAGLLFVALLIVFGSVFPGLVIPLVGVIVLRLRLRVNRESRDLPAGAATRRSAEPAPTLLASLQRRARAVTATATQLLLPLLVAGAVLVPQGAARTPESVTSASFLFILLVVFGPGGRTPRHCAEHTLGIWLRNRRTTIETVAAGGFALLVGLSFMESRLVFWWPF